MTPSLNTISQYGCDKKKTKLSCASTIYFAMGALCYSLAGALFMLESRTELSEFIKPILVAARNIMLNERPVIVTLCLAGLFFAGIVFWFKKDLAVTRQPKKSFVNAVCMLRLSALSILFIYAMFPLKSLHLGLRRSLESFPDLTVFGFILSMLIMFGTIFCCLYCFCSLPGQIAVRIDKAMAKFFTLNEFYIVTAVFLVSLFTTGVLAYFVLDHIPHVQDSIAQLFHAKIFQSGRVFAPLPPHKEFFDYTNIINYDKWYSQYPPGHILMLSLGLIAGYPWLVGPILGTLSLPLFFLLTKSTYRGRQTALISCVLMLFSPFFLFMSSSHMNHTTTLFFILLFLNCYRRIYLTSGAMFALGAGLSLGFVLNVRPLTAVAFGATFVLYMLFSCFVKKEIKLKKVLVFFAGLAVMVGLLLIFNQLTNGTPLTFGYQKKYQVLGFLGKAQVGEPHTLGGGIENTSNNLIGLNQYLFEWPIPSLVFAFIFFAIPIKKNRWDWLFLSAALVLIGSYFFYYYQDLCFGPRFYYAIMPFAIIFSVRGFLGLPKWLEEKGFNRKNARVTLTLLLIVCFSYTFIFSFPRLIKKYSDDYWIVTDKIHAEVQKRGIKNALVFIDVWIPRDVSAPNLIPYGSGFQFNSLDLSDDVIYALDLKEKNVELMNYFSERDFYYCKILTSISDFKLIKINRPEN